MEDYSNMNTNTGSKFSEGLNLKPKIYIPVPVKYITCHLLAFMWTSFAVYVSLNWLRDFSKIVTFPAAFVIIAGIAYFPGYFNAFMAFGLLLDRQPLFKDSFPEKEVTILIAARNEASRIEDTLRCIAKQDYSGDLKVIVIDNGSRDDTAAKATLAANQLGLRLTVIRENNPGKFNALNTGLKNTFSDLVITLDADTILHKSAVRYLVARIESSPDSVAAVAGSILVRNSRDNFLAKMQEWDYFIGIASIKRLQGLYQGTLVAQGAYSIYRTERIKAEGGWPDAIGEDIVLTWNLLKEGWNVYYEPLAVAFTDVPTELRAFARQRSRWARGMIEALKRIKPWQQPQRYSKYLTGINFIMPYIDFTYTLFWIPGLILAFFGIYWIVGPMTLLVLPMTLMSYAVLYTYQRRVFRSLNLSIRKNRWGFIGFVLVYQFLMSPVSVWGYLQEFLSLKRIWK